MVQIAFRVSGAFVHILRNVKVKVGQLFFKRYVNFIYKLYWVWYADIFLRTACKFNKISLYQD